MRRTLTLTATALITALVAACGLSGNRAQAGETVYYHVWGDATSVSVTWKLANGEERSDFIDARSEWTATQSGTLPWQPELSAVADGTGDLNCRIVINDQVISSDHADSQNLGSPFSRPASVDC